MPKDEIEVANMCELIKPDCNIELGGRMMFDFGK